MDAHHNIFYYYRGQLPGGTSASKEAVIEAQIEDNTTKALVNVLELSRDIRAKRRFLDFLLRVAFEGRLGFPIGAVLSADFRLQVPQIGSRPDALLEFKTSASSLKLKVEAKVGAKLSEDQLQRHISDAQKVPLLVISKRSSDRQIVDGFRAKHRQSSIGFCTWGDIYGHFVENSSQRVDNVTKFLKEQFMEYLERSERTFSLNWILCDGYDQGFAIRVLPLLINAVMCHRPIQSLIDRNALMRRPQRYAHWPGTSIESSKRNIAKRLHYDFVIDRPCTAWSLTFFRPRVNKKVNDIVALTESLLGIIRHTLNSDNVSASRFYLAGTLYMLIDYRKGMMRGRSETKVQNELCFDVFRKRPPEKQEELLRTYLENLGTLARQGLIKQFSVTERVTYPYQLQAEQLSAKKKLDPTLLMHSNFQLLRSPAGLVDEIEKFFLLTEPLYKTCMSMVSENTKKQPI